MDNPWSGEPSRHPVLKPTSSQPFNAEPPISVLVDSFKTPNDFFYVINHLPVPEPDIDPKSYELSVELEGTDNNLTLTLDDIKKMPKHSYGRYNVWRQSKI